jgi:hypothetical protein
MPEYEREPCGDMDCSLGGTHFHEAGGDDAVWKLDDDHDSVQEAADQSVTAQPTPGLGGLPAKPRTNLAPNVLGMKLLVYGSCAGIVLLCLVWVIWVYWQ